MRHQVAGSPPTLPRRGRLPIYLALLLIFVFVFTAGLLGCIVEMPPEATAPAETKPGEVSFELVGPSDSAILVPVHIRSQRPENGEGSEGPFNFVLDTGATLTCIDSDLARRLDLPERFGIVGKGVGIGGAGRVGLVEIDVLEVGSASAEALTACTLSLSAMREAGLDVQGLLGLNFLRAFRVTIDFQRRALNLEKEAAGLRGSPSPGTRGALRRPRAG